jgi:maltose O-acetyltransferase
VSSRACDGRSSGPATLLSPKMAGRPVGDGPRAQVSRSGRFPAKTGNRLVYARKMRDRLDWVQKATKIVWRDLSLSMVLIFRNSIAGSVIVPQLLRTVLYRLSGLQIRSWNIREGQIIDNSNLRIGDRTAVNRHCSFEGSGVISIGDDCHIGPETAFITSTHERRSDGWIDGDAIFVDIRIEDDVWVGARCVILPGAVIEKGCTIAAGAVVRGRCVAGKMYGGVPARLIGSSKQEDGKDADSVREPAVESST